MEFDESALSADRWSRDTSSNAFISVGQHSKSSFEPVEVGLSEAMYWTVTRQYGNYPIRIDYFRIADHPGDPLELEAWTI